MDLHNNMILVIMSKIQIPYFTNKKNLIFVFFVFQEIDLSKVCQSLNIIKII